jgi:glycosyltransferase involved in cell wall biosynthesis
LDRVRVAHFVQRYPPALGGSEAYFARLSRFLAASGESVSVFTTRALDLRAFWSRRGECLDTGTTVEDGITIHRYGLLRWPGRRYFLKALSLAPNRLWQCLTLPCNPIAPGMWRTAGRPGQRFDVVHATAFPYAWPIACARRLARRLRVPFLITPFVHLGDPDDAHDPSRRAYLSPALRWLLRSAERIFVQTELERRALPNEGLAEERLIVLGMGVEAAECTGGDRAAARKSWGIAIDEVVIGHLANNSVEKGSVDLLRAAEGAWHSGKQFHVVLAGPEMPNFERFWQQCAQAPKVRRLGVLNDQQKRDFFAGIDIFALPSRSDSFGLVLLEAWANGIPNVAYRAGGVAEVIHHESDGLLVPCGDVNGLATALERLVENPVLRQKLGASGKERTQKEFRWQDKLERVQAVYKEVVDG